MWHTAGEYLYKFLQLLHNLTGNWGLAIVLLTIIIRLILHPLNARQMRSMQQMQRLQPRLKVLQEKYADDRDTLSRETMALYRENKVNPASGCLPLLIQLPILILLFNVLRTTSFDGATFLGVPLEGTVLSSLATAAGQTVTGDTMRVGFGDAFRAISANPAGLANVGTWLPITILLALIIFLMWYQQKLTSQGNPQMKTMNIIMPIFMGFICLSMPGGVILYWMLSSLFAVLQQLYSIKTVAKEEKPVLFKDKPREGEPAEKVVYNRKPAKKEAPAPRKKKKDSFDIPSAKANFEGEYNDFDSFIPRKRK